MYRILPAHQRGAADHGWLKSQHSFSFASYYNPEENGYSDLLVINDDRVAAAKGFGRHPHRNMEIFSYVLDGALEHRDSMGNGSIIRPGDVQLMSAGRGLTHSEFNASASEPMRFLQIWIQPAEKGTEPGYQQRPVSEAEKRGRLRLVVSPDGAEGSLRILQDARIYAGLFDVDESDRLVLPGQRHAYVHLARGSLEVNGQRLNEGDGMRLRDEAEIHLARGDNAEVLVFDLRPLD